MEVDANLEEIMKRQFRNLLGLLLILPILTACGSFNVSFDSESGSEAEPQAAATTAVTATAVPARATATATATTANTISETATSVPPTPEYVVVERLRFRPGATRLAVEGTTGQGVSPRYILGAQTGQAAQISLTSTNDAANYGMTDPNGEPLKRLENEARSMKFEIPTTGDYIISIGAADEDVAYVLTVEIPPVAGQSTAGQSTAGQPTAGQPTEPSPERIQFAAGATAATVEGTANQDGSARYVFWALADQTATIRFVATNSAVSYALTDPSGQPLKRLESEAQSGKFELATTGDYTISISAPASGAQYTLMLEIE